MPAQPFYHKVDEVLFTATRVVSDNEINNVITLALQKIKGVVPESVTVVINDEPEAGDPADL